MKLYKHQIAKSKLEKKGFSEKQINKVYSYKSKADQEYIANRIYGGIKSSRQQKFYKTPLGRYVLKKSINKKIEYTHTEDFKKLAKNEQQKILKKIDKQKLQWEKSLKSITKTQQAKEDLEFKIEKLRARINAGEYTTTQKSTSDSYSVNGTVNKTMIEYVTSHYSDELDKLLQGKKNKKGEWVTEPLTFDEAVNALWEKAIKEGDVQHLAQGAGFGYIDKVDKEVISPV